MKKIIYFLLLLLLTVSLNSCDCYGQTYYPYSNVRYYGYTYNQCPVRYINGIPYYYTLVDGRYCWIVISKVYRHNIRHEYYRYRFRGRHGHRFGGYGERNYNNRHGTQRNSYRNGENLNGGYRNMVMGHRR